MSSSKSKTSVCDIDLYDVLGILQDATFEIIKKAYRKKALKCHPDKNPDNPNAAAEWETLAKAFEVLSDSDARAAYDRVLKARKAAELRNKALESKRRKLKEELESREESFRREQEGVEDSGISLEMRIKQLREEGSDALRREQELMKQEVHDSGSPEEGETPKLKIKWKAKKGDTKNGGYSYAYLKQVFDKYGDVRNLLVSSKRNGSAIIEFSSAFAAEMAVSNEFGLPHNPLQLIWLSGKPERCHVQPAPPSTSNYDDDFENAVLQKLMQAGQANQETNGSQQEKEASSEPPSAPFWNVREDEKGAHDLENLTKPNDGDSDGLFART